MTEHLAEPTDPGTGGRYSASAAVEIRRLGPDNVTQLVEFFEDIKRAGVTERFHPHPFDGETADRLASYAGRDWYGIALAWAPGGSAIAGYIMLRGWDQGYAVPSLGICVHPRWQGVGIGRLLLQCAITVARLRGSPSVRLRVYPDNTRAIELYRRAGFVFGSGVEDEQLVGILPLVEERP